MKVICDLRYENSKKIKIITSLILILSTLFALRLKFDDQKTIKVSDFEIKQNKLNEYSQDLKERIIVNEERVIYDSIKREKHNQFSEKIQKNIGLIINQLNEDLITEITSGLINNEEIIEEENNTFASLASEELITSDDSFGDF
jgi:hypothetical protein